MLSNEAQAESNASLRASLAAAKDFGTTDAATKNFWISKNVLHEELGTFGETTEIYDLNKNTADILIAHGRQDIAHALLNTGSILKELKKIKIVVTACLLVLIFLATKT